MVSSNMIEEKLRQRLGDAFLVWEEAERLRLMRTGKCPSFLSMWRAWNKLDQKKKEWWGNFVSLKDTMTCCTCPSVVRSEEILSGHPWGQRYASKPCVNNPPSISNEQPIGLNLENNYCSLSRDKFKCNECIQDNKISIYQQARHRNPVVYEINSEVNSNYQNGIEVKNDKKVPIGVKSVIIPKHPPLAELFQIRVPFRKLVSLTNWKTLLNYPQISTVATTVQEKDPKISSGKVLNEIQNIENQQVLDNRLMASISKVDVVKKPEITKYNRTIIAKPNVTNVKVQWNRKISQVVDINEVNIESNPNTVGKDIKGKVQTTDDLQHNNNDSLRFEVEDDVTDNSEVFKKPKISVANDFHKVKNSDVIVSNLQKSSKREVKAQELDIDIIENKPEVFEDYIENIFSELNKIEMFTEKDIVKIAVHAKHNVHTAKSETFIKNLRCWSGEVKGLGGIKENICYWNEEHNALEDSLGIPPGWRDEELFNDLDQRTRTRVVSVKIWEPQGATPVIHEPYWNKLRIINRRQYQNWKFPDTDFFNEIDNVLLE